MLKITGTRGSGKTAQLLYYAAAHKAIFVCASTRYANELAERLEIPNRHMIQFMSYTEFNYSMRGTKNEIVIDEIDNFIEYQFGINLTAYTESLE